VTTPPRITGLEGLAETFDIGPRLAEVVRSQCDLRPDERVLDVGCGIGRVALPLADYMTSSGSYEGLDIVAEAVAWCTENITSAHPAFRFRHAPVYNDRYNPGGTVHDDAFVFPYDDASFDVVVLTSVFTHMLPPGVERYISEIARVIEPGGRALITMFLLNDESNRLRNRPASTFSFAYDHGNYAIQRTDVPEAAVAFRETYALRLLEASGFDVQIRYGSWCGRTEYLDFQDVTVCTRK
jgi:ubiquinone/menaquinone biosynthesis C-methylase UbiE